MKKETKIIIYDENAHDEKCIIFISFSYHLDRKTNCHVCHFFRAIVATGFAGL